MCGILGFSWSDESKLNESLQLISHRGPDDEGIWVDEEVSLGHKRLAIIDTSAAGFQPMWYLPDEGAFSRKFRNPDDLAKRFCIIFNGEMYNYASVKRELEGKCYQFKTACDTEVILAAYCEWGTACMKKFNGMWSMCIYDKEKKQLFLSRDRMGIKPLYIWQKNGKIAFGSELKLLISFPEVERKLSSSVLNHFLLFGYTTPGKSILEDIWTLPPGHNLIFDLVEKKIVSNRSYWSIQFSTPSQAMNEEEAVERLRDLLAQSIKRRMIADVPVGAFLSGGVDSSTIVSCMRSNVTDLKTFSVGFDRKNYDESHWAKQVAQQLETDHYAIQFTSTDVKKLLPKLPYHFDEPFGDSSMIPTYLVSQVATQHVTVCLSGTGSDEIFGGYHRYREMRQLRKLLSVPPVLKKLLGLGYKLINSDKAQKLNELLKSSNEAELYLKLFSPGFRGSMEIEVDLHKEKEAIAYLKQNHWLNSLMSFDQQSYLPNDLLVKEDRATMAHSLEGRVPFLDHELVEFANSISPLYKLNGNEGKYLLKKAMSSQLPQELLYRKKQGFGVPLDHYFRTELQSFAEEILFDFSGHDYYQKPELRQLWEAHQSGQSNYASLFWMLISFNLWHDRWIRK